MSGLADGDFGPVRDRDGVTLRDRGRPLIRERGAGGHHRNDGGDEREKSQDHAKLLGLGVLWDASVVPGARAAAPGTRTTSTGVTPELTEIWPQVRPRLLAYLVARGISPANADDVVQDVAERVIRHRIDFVDADDLLRWCVPVARHASIDQHRRTTRLVSIHSVADCAEADDLTETVGARLRLRRVMDGWGKLSSTDRETLVDAALDDAGLALDSATRVRRHRARKRLLELVGPAAAAAWAIRVARRIGRTGVAVVTPAAVAASFVIGAGGGSVAAPAIAAMPPDQPRAASQAHAPVAAGSVVHRPQPHAYSIVVTSPRMAVRPGQQAPVRIYGHDRRAQDRGLVCVTSVPVVSSLCVGPT